MAKSEANMPVETFSSAFSKNSKTMHVTVNGHFPIDDWGPLMEFYRQKNDSGVLNWELDLRNLTTLNSTSLGKLITLNASLSKRRGSLTVVVGNGSYLEKLLRSTQLDRILRIRVA